MTTITDFNPPRTIAQSQTGYFYFYMALACTAVAFLGFAADRLNHLQFLTIRQFLSLVFAALVLLLLVLAIWP